MKLQGFIFNYNQKMLITYLNKSILSLILSFLLHLFSVGQVSSSSITQKGHYYGKNLFIQNTEISTNEFSVYSVYVNEIPIKSPINIAEPKMGKQILIAVIIVSLLKNTT